MKNNKSSNVLLFSDLLFETLRVLIKSSFLLFFLYIQETNGVD